MAEYSELLNELQNYNKNTLKACTDEFEETINLLNQQVRDYEENGTEYEEVFDGHYRYLTTAQVKISQEDFMFPQGKNQAAVYSSQLSALKYAAQANSYVKKEAELISSIKRCLQVKDLSICNLYIFKHALNDKVIKELCALNLGYSEKQLKRIEEKDCNLSGMKYSDAVKCAEILSKNSIKSEIRNKFIEDTGNETLKKYDKSADIQSQCNTNYNSESKKLKSKRVTRLIWAIIFTVISLIEFTVFTLSFDVEWETGYIVMTVVPLFIAFLIYILAISCTFKLKKCKATYSYYSKKIAEQSWYLKTGIAIEVAAKYGEKTEKAYNLMVSKINEVLPIYEQKYERNLQECKQNTAFMPPIIADDNYLLSKIISLMESGMACDYKEALTKAQQQIREEQDRQEAKNRAERQFRAEQAHREAVLESQRRAEQYAQQQAEYARSQAESAAAMLESQKRSEEYAKKQAEYEKEQARLAADADWRDRQRFEHGD